jgi:hypothetical protein
MKRRRKEIENKDEVVWQVTKLLIQRDDEKEMFNLIIDLNHIKDLDYDKLVRVCNIWITQEKKRIYNEIQKLDLMNLNMVYNIHAFDKIPEE